MSGMTFEQMKAEFERLCRHYEVPVPDISEALPEDPCDVTDPPFVRINLRQECKRLYQVQHLFGHWLHDIAYWDPENTGGAPYSDVVADVIAQMISDTYGAFLLTPSEQAHADKWVEQHRKDEPISYTGAIGGRFVYEFIPTSINIVKHVRCSVCGATELLNDMGFISRKLGRSSRGEEDPDE